MGKGGCTRTNLARGTLCLCTMMMFSSFIVMFVGGLMATDIHTEWAYGHSINLKGAFLAFFGAITFVSQLCGLFGAIHHNKFCLLIFWISMVVNQILQASLASSIQVQITSAFTSEFQRSCLEGTDFIRWETGEPDHYTRGKNSPECDAYLNDPATLKLQTMWYNMYRMSLARHDSAEDFSRLNALIFTAVAWMFIPACCFAIS